MLKWLPFLGLLLVASESLAQDRDTKVRNDRAAFQESKDWFYNDLSRAIPAARASGKPIMVVFRCIPCEACQEFDDDVARRDPVIRDLLDEYVCVRIVKANTIDLATFQHDFDQSFAAYLMNPDMTLYGRFGTRSWRPEHEDISLEGLRKAMKEALRMHREYEAFKPLLAEKQVQEVRYKTPRDYPSLSGKYGEQIDYEGKTAKSCMHCHQVREAERMVFRMEDEPIPDPVLFPYPDPEVLGLKLDPKEMAKVERVEPASIAESAGLRPGDEIVTLAGQPLLSIADVQWVLHNTPSSATLKAGIRRDGATSDVALKLPEGWRRGNISWRATTWDLRRMGLGGLKLVALDESRRAGAGLAKEGMAFRVEHVGQYGNHAVAKNAGFLKGDIIVGFDGQTGKLSESELLAYTLQQKKRGEEVAVTVLRDGKELTLKFALQ
ncbi:Trx7/PDZ domain-containing (seleno)protein [Tundrisphaera lichenicola]|uniref:Trx7/PDZ domain-containing (seleno)protein n=1 Tax=Tundrisphaera lichenicola TaxID=2029860 RepID=UPI003EBC7C3E